MISVVQMPQFSSVAQSFLTLCNPMRWSTPGFPVHLQLPEFTQTRVHCLSQWCQPSHSLLSSSPPAFSLSQHQGLSKWGDQRFGVSASASVLPMNIQDWFPLGWTGWISLQSKGVLLEHHNSDAYINFLLLFFLF